MSLYDDITMGLGIRKPDDAYHERTAETIAKNQGQAAADRYTANNPPSGSGSDSGSTGLPKTATVRPVARPDVIERDATGKITGSSYSEGNKPTFEQLYPAVSSGRTDEYSSDFLTLPAAKQEGLSAMLTSAPQRALGYLGGARSDDPIVNIIDGKPVYRDSEGRTYSYNALGMSYNTKDENTLDEDPMQVQKRESIMAGMGSGDDDSPAPMQDAGPADPCPDGYVYDEDQMMCVIDPDTGLLPDTPSAPTYELPDPMNVTPGGNPGYTQPIGNFIPTPLQPMAPNPIQQQLTQMNRMMRGPQQRQQQSGLAGANTGIMQVRR
jgi:hypothetical protein